MADDSFSSDDFDKLLDDFISSQLQDAEEALAELNETPVSASSSSKEAESSSEEENVPLSDIVNRIYDADAAKLADEEKRLFEAYRGLVSAAKICGEEAGVAIPDFVFTAKDLLPRFRPNNTDKLNQDILNAWEILIAAQPIRLTSLPLNASDEQILSFAEKTTDKNLQISLISYVETLIEIDSCEIAYNMRRVKYEKHKIEKKIFEEQQRRRDKMRKYIDAIRAKHFPVDADMLVTNFFKTVRKDPDGAQKMLENNPATFAPIQVDKIPSRLFGLVKPKPEDGIKVNKKLGKFLKKLKA